MSPERVRRPRDRKGTIVAAAAELFGSRGFAAVGIDDIGRRAGITGPAIYRHFKGKDAVLDAVLVDFVSRFATPDALVDRGIREVVEAAFVTALDRPESLAAYIRERRQLSGARLEPVRRAERQEFRQWCRAIAAANPDLDHRRIAVRQAAALGALSTLALRPPTMPRERLVGLVVDALTAVLVHPPTPAVPLGEPEPTWHAPVSKRQEILDAALLLFRSRGFRGVGIDEIGEAAGISGPTVYFYFDDKSQILVDAFDRAGTRVAGGVQEALLRATSAADALTRLVGNYVEVAVDSSDLIAVTSREGHALAEPDRSRMSRRRREIREAWVAVLGERRPDLPEGAARTLVAGVFPLINQLAQRGEGSGEIRELAETFLLSAAPTSPS